MSGCCFAFLAFRPTHPHSTVNQQKLQFSDSTHPTAHLFANVMVPKLIEMLLQKLFDPIVVEHTLVAAERVNICLAREFCGIVIKRDLTLSY